MQSHLDKGLATLQSQGQPLRQRISPEGYKIIEPATAEPAFGWAIVNDYYVYALGPISSKKDDRPPYKDSLQWVGPAFGTKRNASTAILRLGVMISRSRPSYKMQGLHRAARLCKACSRSAEAHWRLSLEP